MVRPAIQMNGPALLGRVSGKTGAADEVPLGTGLAFSNGKLTSSNVVVQQGPAGPAGPTGAQGPAGQNGQDGRDGQGALPWVDIKADFDAVGDGNSAAADKAAFSEFRDWARQQGDTRILLVIPPGDYTVSGFDESWFLDGINHITVYAYGATVRSVIFGSVIAVPDDTAAAKRINTVARGSTTVTCTTAAHAAIFSAGDWVYISCIDLQGFGAPPNNHVFEFQQVASVNTDTGVITLVEALTNSYKSTYPVFNAGDALHPHCGGPGMIYRLHDSWDCENYIFGGTFIHAGQNQFKGRRCVFTDCFISGPGFAPTVSRQTKFVRCLFDGDIESDKAVQLLEFENCEVSQINTQSSSINKMVIDGTRIYSEVNGTAKNTVIRNSDVPVLRVGPTAYGIMESCYLENCVVGDVSYNIHDPVTIASYTVDDGSITIPIASGPLPGMTVPGAVWMYETNGQPFKILDVTQDGTNYLVKTTLPDPVVTPASQFGAGGVVRQWRLWNPHNNVRAVNCTGCPEIVDICKSTTGIGKSYAKRGFVGNPYQYPDGGHIVGLVETITVKVLRAFTGTGALTVKMNDYCIDQTDQSGAYEDLFIVNLRTAGTRVIARTGNSGAVAGDTLPDITGGMWKTGSTITLEVSADRTGETFDKYPIFSVEITTSQGDVFFDNWLLDNSTYIG